MNQTKTKQKWLFPFLHFQYLNIKFSYSKKLDSKIVLFSHRTHSQVMTIFKSYFYQWCVYFLSHAWLMHLDLLMCLNTFYSQIAEIQSWKLVCMTLSYTVQTMSTSKTRKCYLKNYGKKKTLVRKLSICVSSAWGLFSSIILHTAFTLPLFVPEIVENLLARSVYA